ncbi:site-specific integrase [Vibrio parahaemolyticus]|uniref:tyrosine-type recombinase/integrase n=1 Tax=Vibrio harveyi group TaxID=717610 RepID=UPI00111F6B9A|nr:site-specific integrase [Vibrio parahaemolyticus]EHK2921400.1 site-specific integrase [Vibrio parahaemolyticus]EHK7585783.1 site-specific integrase [Vibrio parahaemolyticus]EJK2423442.1 site-specific integrase [Vibrio parahaemolyticus]ELA7271853.1 site-specific integrase [Vibrio parahaemolyticus]ELA7340777.1 site-specific integrase [Vibrio parahaemolyticus]
MGRQKRMVPESFGDGDYSIVRTIVDKYPRVSFEADGEGGNRQKLIHHHYKSPHPTVIDIPLLCDGRGRNVIPANLYLRFKAKHDSKPQTLKDYSQALLAFYRFMLIKGLNIYDVCEEKEKGVVYKFRDFLLENVKREVNGDISGFYSRSTAISYTLKIVDYFNFLNASKIIEIKDDFVPFEYKAVSIQKRKSKQKRVDDLKLGHLEKGMNSIKVMTTGLTKPFGHVQIVEPHKKLKPMSDTDKQLFLEALGDDFSDPKDLMLNLSLVSGLRLEEFITFPLSEVQDPKAEVVKCTISELRNGCLTKFSKERTIEIPFEAMNQLNLYRLSTSRANAYNRCWLNHNCLFVKSDGYPFSSNTLEKRFAEIRDKIRESHPEWYYRVHDLRATFATHWLCDKHIETGLPFDALLEDLKELMGHEHASETEKYIKFMNAKENWFKFARMQNANADELFNK